MGQMKLSKFDLEIQEFKCAFEKFKDRKIVLYGTGRMTATLVGGIGDKYQIIGLCDREDSQIGNEIYGKPILKKEEAEKEADLLVINTDATYWNTIYKRIQDWKIPIYYRNGQRAFLEEAKYTDHPYWSSSFEELEKTIKQYEIVSFDIFDTLITRKVMSPFDVFRLVELRLKRKYKDIAFCMERKKAASILENPSYDKIYEKLRELSGWDEELIALAKILELDTEKKLIVPRQDMVDLCNSTMKEKQVYFISDMYFTKEILLELLLHAGVDARKEQIIVSCELDKDKNSGSLWKWYKENLVKEHKAIHIGDNINGDVKQPRECGINSYYIMSTNDMIKNSSIQDIVSDVISLQSSIAMGMIGAKILNSPFSLNRTKGKIFFENNIDTGYTLLGNAMYNFHLWLMESAEKDDINQLLFFAREGYLLLPQYEYMCRLLEKNQAAQGKYLEISRRAIFIASIKNIEGIIEVAEFPFQGNAYEFFKDRFGVTIEEEHLKTVQMLDIQKDEKNLKAFIEPYTNMILQEAEQERKNYITYLTKFDIDERTGVVDSALYGTTQHYLQNVLNQRVIGYYFCACLDESNPYHETNHMRGCFQAKEDTSGKKCAMFNNSKFNEAYYTAPKGMLVCLDDDGTPKYSENMKNQTYFDVRYSMQEGIFQYFSEIIELQKDLGIADLLVDQEFADRLYGCMMKDGFEVTKEMKQGFYFDNKMLNNRESKIWEE